MWGNPCICLYTLQVYPSGQLKVGKDYRVAQAAAGSTFSVTREANGDDAVQAVEGFLWMKAVSMCTYKRTIYIMVERSNFGTKARSE